MEWVMLLLLVPAIVVPVVLLLGFAGCDEILGLEPPHYEQTFVATLTNLDVLRGRCLVQRIESSRLSDSGAGVRITLQALAETVEIDRILISQVAPAGDPYDSAGDLTDVATAVVVQANSTVTLPAVDNYTIDRTKPLLIAMDIAATSGAVPYFPDVPDGEAVAFFRPGAEAAVNDRQPSYTSRPRIYLIGLIEVLTA
jgi:hypothetical protein